MQISLATEAVLYFTPIYNQSLKWKIAALICWLFILTWRRLSLIQALCLPGCWKVIKPADLCFLWNQRGEFPQDGKNSHRYAGEAARGLMRICVWIQLSLSRLLEALFCHLQARSFPLSFPFLSLSLIINLALSHNSLHGPRACSFFFSSTCTCASEILPVADL